MEHLIAGEQSFVYRRGGTIVALNNDTTAVTLQLPVATLPGDALGICPAPRRAGTTVTIVVPARGGCVF